MRNYKAMCAMAVAQEYFYELQLTLFQFSLSKPSCFASIADLLLAAGALIQVVD